MGGVEQILDALHRAFGDVYGRSILLILTGQEMLIPDLLINLFLGAYKRNPIYTRHDRLLHRLPLNIPPEFIRQILHLGAGILRITLDHIRHHPRHMRVQISRFVQHIKVDLGGSLGVSP